MGARDLSRAELTFKPVTLDEWDDLQALFSESGPHHGCWCMYWRVRREDFHRHYGEGHRAALHDIIALGRVPGLLAYHEGRPVGWCSVAAREEFPVLDRSPKLKRVDDQPVWSIVCFYVSRSYRRRGLTRALTEAAIEYAQAHGARIIEAYPVMAEGDSCPRYEMYTGVVSTFEQLGFRQAIHRGGRRPVMRLTIEQQTEEGS